MPATHANTPESPIGPHPAQLRTVAAVALEADWADPHPRMATTANPRLDRDVLTVTAPAPATPIITDADRRRTMEPFAKESKLRSWSVLLSSVFLMVAALVVAALIPMALWPLRILASVVGGLIMVRIFIIYHDHWHGSFLRNSRIAGWFFTAYGMLVMSPKRMWKYSHNHHHAHVGKPAKKGAGDMPLVVSEIGSFPLMSIDQWLNASWQHKLLYRVTRHPITLVFANITVFALSLCLIPAIQSPKKFWDGLVALAVHAALLTGMIVGLGFEITFFALILPYLVAASAGAFLFFVQHNYPGMKLMPEAEWTVQEAAMESSGFLALGPIGRWFTGNIGFHHVHHLNSRIPFYRLPAASEALANLEPLPVVKIGLFDMYACTRLNLWDATRDELVPYSAARKQARLRRAEALAVGALPVIDNPAAVSVPSGG